jgi:hypothetical protein
MSEVDQPDGVWLSNRQAWQLIGVKKATFYRKYYAKLISDSATRWLNGHPRYQRSQVEDLLKPDRPLRQPVICAKSEKPPEATAGLGDQADVHNSARAGQLVQKRKKPGTAESGAGQLGLFTVLEEE